MQRRISNTLLPLTIAVAIPLLAQGTGGRGGWGGTLRAVYQSGGLRAH